MCLSEVASTTRDRKREGFGWKAFTILNENPISQYYGGYRKVGRWLKSRNDGSEKYMLGFHVFRTRREARIYAKYSSLKILKVRFRDILAEGTQYFGELRIIVAKEMLILEN